MPPTQRHVTTTASGRSRSWPVVRASMGVSEVVRRPSKNKVIFCSACRLASRPPTPYGKRRTTTCNFIFILFFLVPCTPTTKCWKTAHIQYMKMDGWLKRRDIFLKHAAHPAVTRAHILYERVRSQCKRYFSIIWMYCCTAYLPNYYFRMKFLVFLSISIFVVSDGIIPTPSLPYPCEAHVDYMFKNMKSRSNFFRRKVGSFYVLPALSMAPNDKFFDV